MLLVLTHFSKTHTWILPVFAVGLGAPRWCQVLEWLYNLLPTTDLPRSLDVMGYVIVSFVYPMGRQRWPLSGRFSLAVVGRP